MADHPPLRRPLRRLLSALGVLAAILAIALVSDYRSAPAGLPRVSFGKANPTSPPQSQSPMRRGPATLFDGGVNDSVIVYGPTSFTADDPNWWSSYEESFSATALAGRRYILELVNASGYGVSAMVWVNGQQFVGSQEFGTGSTSLKRIVDTVATSNTISIQTKGQAGASCTIRIVHVPDSTYSVFGYKTYTKSGGVSTYRDTFVLDTVNAGPPYLLRMINGTPGGLNRITSGNFKLNGSTVLSSPTNFKSGVATATVEVTLQDTNALELNNNSANGTLAKFQFRARDITPPVVTLTAPTADTTYTKSSSITVSGSVADQTAGTVTVNGSGGTATPGNFSSNVSLPADGWYTATVNATNSASLTTSLQRQVARDTRPPAVNLSVIPDSTTDSLLTFGIGWRDTTRTIVTCDGDTVGIARYDSAAVSDYPLDFGPNRIFVRAVDAVSETTTVTRIVLRKHSSDAPPAPLSAPALSVTDITPFRDAVAFLFTGGGAVQVGANGASITADRAAVLRGKVVARDWGPIPNVRVRVLGHPEYGETMTRANGEFDLVVNGGASLVVRFSKLGYLESQRRVDPPVNTFLTLDDVAMVGRSARVLDVDLESATVFRSRFATDANGDRDIRLYFPGAMRARMATVTNPDSEFRYVKVRATEYTQGAQGDESMPAQLPPSSAYTYCVELTLDEADVIANVTGEPVAVRFTKPLSCYVRNFLSYPVGARVPFGAYDRKSGLWSAEDDALVLKIVEAAGDTALIDLTGDGVADTSTALLDSLGLSVPERQVLLSEYGVNAVLWRARLSHFTAPDANPNAGPPPDELPRGPGPIFKFLGNILGPCLWGGSIIECENRILGERLPITGTPYTLNYRSFRAPGDSASRTVRIPVIGDSIPPTLDRVYVQLEAAGKVYKREVPRAELEPGEVVPITWDGYDVYGRRIEGSINAQVSVGHRYGAFAMQVLPGSRGFGNSGRNGGQLTITGDRDVRRVNWIRRKIALGTPGTGSDGLGGWTISPHHVFDPNGKGAVYYGSGDFDSGDRIPMSRWRYSNLWNTGYTCDNIDEDTLSVANIRVRVTALALAGDGTVYLADHCRGSIYRFGKDRVLHRVAGNGNASGNFSGEGGLATSATLQSIDDLAIAPDGTVYFTARWSGGYSLIGKVGADGILRRIIGDNVYFSYGGPYGTGGDNGYIGAAKTSEIYGLACGPDGSLFFAESGPVASGGNYSRVRRIGTDSTITTYAGGPCRASSDSTGAAVGLCLGDLSDVGLDTEGNLYVLEGPSSRLRKVTPEGRLKTVVYRYNAHFVPGALSFAPDGSVYLANGGGYIPNQSQGVYRVDPDSNLFLIAGGAASGTHFEGAPVTTVPMTDVSEVAVLPDGSYYVVSGFELFLVTQRFATDLGNEWMVPNQDGSEMYFFTKTGRHLRTRDALTGTLRYWFDYDASGRLIAIHDGDGGTTTVARNGSGAPLTVVAPDGQVTTVTDSSGWLSRVANPADETTRFAYTSGGLLTRLTNARGYSSTFEWSSSEGRLDRDNDAGGGYQEFTTDSVLSRLRIVWRTSGLNRKTMYRVAPRDDGTMLRQVKDPAGQVANTDYRLDTSVETTLPGNTVVTDRITGDPRFSIVAPVPAEARIGLPSGLTKTVQVSRPYSALTFNPPAITTDPWTEEVLINGTDTARTVFDAANHRLTVQRSLARKTTVTVDTAGRPIAIHVPGLDTLRREYDSRGRLTELRQGNRGWRMLYDARGRVSTLWDTLGRTTTLRYDAADRCTAQTLPGGRTVRFGYDPAGNLVSLTPPGQPAHEFDYNGLDLTSRYRPPGTGLSDSLTEYVFNLDRQLTDVLRPDGSDITLAYGGTTGRIERVTTPRGDAEFGYDGSGRLWTLGSPDGVTLTYTYNGLIPTQEAWSGTVSGTVAVTLDDQFRAESQRINGGSEITYDYDRDGLVTQAGALAIDRREDNGLIRGTSLQGSAIATTESYNAHGEPELSVALDGTDTLWSALYSRDPLGRITAIRENLLGMVSLCGYAYSDTGFLVRVTVGGTVRERYGYDANGNRLRYDAPGDSATGAYDHQDRMFRYRDTRYSYSASGELTKAKHGNDSTLYTYDPLGNLIEVVQPNGDTIAYLIDGRNRRVARKLNGTVTHRWLYQDQFEPVAELDGNGNLVARYIYGTRTHVPDYVVKGGTAYRVISDYLGSVRLVVNAQTGVVAQRIEYSAFGQDTLDTNPGFQCFGYAGGLSDSATGLIRFGVRDYDPRTGRWLAKDPILFAGGDPNVYVYAGNLPTCVRDPLGLSVQDGFWDRVADNYLTTNRALGDLGIQAAAAAVGAKVVKNTEGIPTLYDWIRNGAPRLPAANAPFTTLESAVLVIVVQTIMRPIAVLTAFQVGVAVGSVINVAAQDAVALRDVICRWLKGSGAGGRRPGVASGGRR